MPTMINGPTSDSKTTSHCAVVPAAYIGAVPVVVKMPTLKEKARRKGSSMASSSCPRIVSLPSAPYARAKTPFTSRSAASAHMRNAVHEAESARR